ncbi:MAG: endonuclease VII domain-containing protein [Pyrinomonadaceae bacterium]|nr:endonuclease VII domain-containing protein [Pyrinomonadaceae bacterium]
MRITKNCTNCGKEYSTFPYLADKRKFCSVPCKRKIVYRKFNCRFCGKENTVPKSRKKYFCNNECRLEQKRQNSFIVNCFGCEKVIKIPFSRLKKQYKTFCSKKCYTKNSTSWENNIRICTSCRIGKSREHFYKSKNTLNLSARCIECSRAYDRRKRFEKVWGITETEYNSMLIQQNYGCAICGGVNSDRNLAIDHCHDSGKIRALLCGRCNIGIGLFADSIYLLEKVIEYLKLHSIGKK